MITLYSCCARQDNVVPLTLTLEDTVDEVALVEAAIGPLVAPTAIFLSLVVLALEADLALLPRFGAHPVLMVVQPVTFVRAALRVYEYAPTISHAVFPLALIHAAIGLNHAPEPLHLPLDELALVLGPVRPN